MNKVIWYLHHYAGSPSIGMSYRPYYLSVEFNKLGYKSYVIAASFHHLLNRISNQHESVKQELLDDINYIWLKTLSYRGNGIKRLLNMFSYALKIGMYAKKIIKITDKPDVIIVSSAHPIHYMMARKIAKRYNAKLIFEVRDIWPLSLVDILHCSPYHPFIKFLGYIEKLAYREADYVVSVLPNAFKHMQKYGLNIERFIYIPNGVFVNNFVTLEKKQFLVLEKVKQLKAEKKFIIGYAGTHGIPNALEQLIDAMIVLQNKGIDSIHAILVGKGEQKEKLLEKSIGLKNITFLDPVDKFVVSSVLELMDATFIGWRDLPIYQYGVSANKIFDYMLAAKPIISASNISVDPVLEANSGLIVAPEQPKQLADAIFKLSNLSTQQLDELGQNGRKYVELNHSYKNLAGKYTMLFG